MRVRVRVCVVVVVVVDNDNHDATVLASLLLHKIGVVVVVVVLHPHVLYLFGKAKMLISLLGLVNTWTKEDCPSIFAINTIVTMPRR